MERLILAGLENLPVVSFYARTRGWHFVIAWMHRITGIMITIYVCVHIYTLSFLSVPADYDAKMKILGVFFFYFLEWLLAIPVIFHALNGGRLILYEIFESRADGSMIRWVFGLCAIYIALLGLLMIMGSQSVSPIFFWLTIFISAVLILYLVASKIFQNAETIFWKLQRVAGAYLLLMIPAHFLFMHLQPAVAHEATTVIARMKHPFIKFVDLSLIISVLYHAGYGIISICKDYFRDTRVHLILTALTVLIMAGFGWIGFRLTILI